MSMTYDIACTKCKKHLWIGQGYDKLFRTYTGHKDEHGQRHLDRFLWEHCGHSLLILDEGADYEGLEKVEYTEHES